MALLTDEPPNSKPAYNTASLLVFIFPWASHFHLNRSLTNTSKSYSG